MARHAAPNLRRAQTATPADFDEQLWPINCTIIVLAGFLAGLVYARSDFYSPETALLDNGYVRLGLVGLLVGLLLWAVTWLHARMVRRVQFCVLFSLLVHLGLALYLHGQYLALVAMKETAAPLEEVLPHERITVPDYYWHHPDQPHSVESFERPVETESPEPLAIDPIQRHPTEQEATLERPAPVEPERSESRRPDPAEMRRADLEPPQRPDETGQITRQEWHHRPEPDDRIDLPEIPPTHAVEPTEPPVLQPPPALAQREAELPEAMRQAADRPSPPSSLAQLSPAMTDRAVPSSEQLPKLDPIPATPMTLDRTMGGVNLPSATTAAENVAAPAAIGGATPSSIEIVSATAPVQRSDDLALRGADTAAAGAAEFALGSLPVVAQVGQRRAVGNTRPSVDPSDTLRRIARASTGPPIPAINHPEIAQVPTVAAAFGGGGPPTPSPDARGTPIGWAGSVGIPARVPTSVAGSGRPISPGMAGRLAAAELARVTGQVTISGAPAGGGIPVPARMLGRAPASDATVESLPLATGPASGGFATGPQLEAQASGQEQPTVGLPGSLQAQPQPGVPESLANAGPLLPAAVARRASPSQEASGRVGPSPANSATLAKANFGPKLPAAVAPFEDVPVPGGGGVAAAQGGQPSLLEIGPDVQLRAAVSGVSGTPNVGQMAGGPPVRVAVALVPVGPSSEGPAEAEIPGRRAAPEHEVVLAVARQFVAKRSGGRAAIDGRIRELPAEAFQQRTPGRRSEVLKQYGSTEGSERAVEMGLDFLARHQFPDGHWGLDQFSQAGVPQDAGAAPGSMQADTAATGLALLAFLGAGYTHVDNKHRAVVQKAIDWLVANQESNGQLFTIATDRDRAARIYGHGFGAIALCEAYGMTADPGLREPARKAIQFIIDAQHPTLGGWRYTKRDDEATWRKESDTSVSGWQLMALKSAQMAGLDVPPEVMEKVGRWLDLAQADGGSRYMYNPYPGSDPEQRVRGLVPNRAMTAEGLLMRMYLGWDRDHPAMISGADYLKENLPELGARAQPLRDVYYWYYATQVMFQMQGDHWAAWNDRLRPLLEESQVQEGPLAGSWDPDRPVADRWAHAGGRLYVTGLNLLMLEVYYRYLPLFKTLADDVLVTDQ